ncbi:hypothetical protein [Companilactobacillus ginsenosidimutans]|uniref:Uncharacterized protein n=1 Tax=Companilactobacillus ginsenosidimutans TaxID=1007676 RepID=A0A0H4QJN7_9LACO|nr:hypothetical protein [Companilactobacillus ginsenosidimutans]AKP67256.1 hypothetical protein ABM34_06690 [Companilactobacillus ginsenosidimutans]
MRKIDYKKYPRDMSFLIKEIVSEKGEFSRESLENNIRQLRGYRNIPSDKLQRLIFDDKLQLSFQGEDERESILDKLVIHYNEVTSDPIDFDNEPSQAHQHNVLIGFIRNLFN